MRPKGMEEIFMEHQALRCRKSVLRRMSIPGQLTKKILYPLCFGPKWGALISPSGSEYPGELHTSKGMVLVSINYRLGRFGFNVHELQLPSQENPSGVSADQGPRDQIFAQSGFMTTYRNLLEIRTT